MKKSKIREIVKEQLKSIKEDKESIHGFVNNILSPQKEEIISMVDSGGKGTIGKATDSAPTSRMASRSPYPTSSFGLYGLSVYLTSGETAVNAHLNYPMELTNKEVHTSIVDKIEKSFTDNNLRFRKTKDVVGGSNTVVEWLVAY